MIQYVSTTGGVDAVDFETAILNGRAPDGGLYVPNELPKISLQQLQSWQQLSYTELAFEILSLFIDRTVIPERELKQLISDSFSTFHHPDKILVRPFDSERSIFIQELFHGPTLSFKDVAMGFVVNLFDFFLKRKGQQMTIMVATSGDTGPAAAFASIGKETLNAWVLYPPELITREQIRQMTTITAPNIHAVGVSGCADGSDDLEKLIAGLFADEKFKTEMNLSSVNSINWGRIMMQMVHYFYGYFRTVDRVGELLNFAVPSGAFGNLCAGSMAREMGLPVGKFIIANNANACLQRIFSEGVFSKEPVVTTHACSIDISIPINFWRHLYLSTGRLPDKIKKWIVEFEQNGHVAFDPETHQCLKKGFLTTSISDSLILETIRRVYSTEQYLLDPHAAVAVAATQHLKPQLAGSKTLCLATAHPAKFPEIIKQAIGTIPDSGKHSSIESAKSSCQRIYSCHFDDMHTSIPQIMVAYKRHKRETLRVR